MPARSATAALSRARKGVELWDYFLAFVLGIALFECFFSNRLAAGASGRSAAGASEHAAAGSASAAAPQR